MNKFIRNKIRKGKRWEIYNIYVAKSGSKSFRGKKWPDGTSAYWAKAVKFAYTVEEKVDIESLNRSKAYRLYKKNTNAAYAKTVKIYRDGTARYWRDEAKAILENKGSILGRRDLSTKKLEERKGSESANFFDLQKIFVSQTSKEFYADKLNSSDQIDFKELVRIGDIYINKIESGMRNRIPIWGNLFYSVYLFMKKYKIRNPQIQIVTLAAIIDGKTRHSSTYNAFGKTKVTDILSWLDEKFYSGEDGWRYDSEFSIIDGYDPRDVKIVIFPGKYVTSKKSNVQVFLDGEEHCLLHPILVYNKERADNKSLAKSTQKRYGRVVRQIEKLIVQYGKGVPADVIPDICEELRCGVKLLNVLKIGSRGGPVIKGYGKATCRKIFTYINTRHNHLDAYVETGRAEELDRKEIEEKYSELESRNVFMITGRSRHDITRIDTCGFGSYILRDEYFTAVKKFEKEYNFRKYAINGVKNEELVAYIRSGCHFTGAVNFKNGEKANVELLTQVDQKKAYTQFRKCEYYCKFPGILQHFRKVECTDKKKFLGTHFGMFTIANVDITNVQYSEYIKKLGVYDKNIEYTNPELLFMLDIGITFDIVSGAWSSNTFDFEFPSYMLEKDEVGKPLHDGTRLKISRYSKWSGMQARYSPMKVVWLKGDEQYARDLKSDKNTVTFHKELNRISVQYKKEFCYTNVMITAYITAYSRIQTLRQLFKIPFNKVVKLVTDGVYFYGKTDLNPKFVYKKIETYFDMLVPGKLFHYIKLYGKGPTAPYMKPGNQIYIGAGGSGKTYSALTDTGFINVTFTTTSWKLASEKKKFGKTCTVNAIALGINCEDKLARRPPGVLIIDECTMITDYTKNKFIRKFPLTVLVFCGDFDLAGKSYQLNPFGGQGSSPMSLSDLNITEFKKNYRTKDVELLKMLNGLRKGIVPKYKCISRQEVYDRYKITDFVLVSKTRCRKHKQDTCNCDGMNYVKGYTDLLKDKFSVKKYRITKRVEGLYNGDIVYTSGKSRKEQHAFTVHSIQGLTISDETIFIDTRTLFDLNMLYTAISRATTMSQIVFCM